MAVRPARVRAVAASTWPRVLLLVHIILLVYVGIREPLKDGYTFLLILGPVAVTIEFLVTVVARRGVETQWVNTSVLVFLVCSFPLYWALELKWQDKVLRDTIDPINATDCSSANNIDNLFSNTASVTSCQSVTQREWIVSLQQTMFFLVILVSWFLMKPRFTKQTRTRLLFTYMTIALDSMEMFNLFDIGYIRADRDLVIVILTVWTISLLQFCVDLAVTRPPKNSLPSPLPWDTDDVVFDVAKFREGCGKCCCTRDCWNSETRIILTILLLQDVPFLLLRLYLICNFRRLSFNMIFFILKNGFLVAFYVYRLISKYCLDDDELETIVALSSHQGSTHMTTVRRSDSGGSQSKKYKKTPQAFVSVSDRGSQSSSRVFRIRRKKDLNKPQLGTGFDTVNSIEFIPENTSRRNSRTRETSTDSDSGLPRSNRSSPHGTPSNSPAPSNAPSSITRFSFHEGGHGYLQPSGYPSYMTPGKDSPREGKSMAFAFGGINQSTWDTHM